MPHDAGTGTGPPAEPGLALSLLRMSSPLETLVSVLPVVSTVTTAY